MRRLEHDDDDTFLLIFLVDYVVLLACVILIGLFALQHHGTEKVGALFAPIVIAWLFCISSIGVYNIFRWNPGVFKALSPFYMYNFLKKTQIDGLISLGGVLLCITGMMFNQFVSLRGRKMHTQTEFITNKKETVCFECIIINALFAKHNVVADGWNLS